MLIYNFDFIVRKKKLSNSFIKEYFNNIKLYDLLYWRRIVNLTY